MTGHEKWVISDHHLFHANTWKMFKAPDGVSPLRPFLSNEEMHKVILLCHNSVVGDNDFVYLLGDLTFKYGPEFDNIMYQLKGQFRFVPGNHDDLVQLVNHMHHFKKAKGVWYAGEGDDDGKNPFTMSHVPQRLEQIRWGEYNVHGHTHANYVLDQWGKHHPNYINVCVEPRNFTPVHFDTIHEEIKQRES